MRCLEDLSPRVEQYSIDEMFLDVGGIDNCIAFEDFGRQVRAHVHKHTALTVGVGMGPTKTLAKSAQWASKQWKQFGGVLALTTGNPQRTENCSPSACRGNMGRGAETDPDVKHDGY